jgi:hypothetical protein
MAQEKHDSPDPIDVLPPDLELQVVPVAPVPAVDVRFMIVPLSAIDYVWSIPVKRGIS